MHVWNATFDAKTGGWTHTLKTASGHSLLVPVVGSAFQELDLSASLCDGRFWWAIHSGPTMVPFEVEHGVDAGRWKYNGRSFTAVLRKGTPLTGHHMGYSDLFVPVVVQGEISAILVAGSFAEARATSTDVLERWRKMTGRQGHPADPAFSAYLRAALSIVVLDGGKAQLLERLLVCLAKLLGGEGRADALANEAQALRIRLEPARFVERAWESARTMLDERSSHAHYSSARANEMRRLGLIRAPDHVLVGLATTGKREVDPVEEAIVRDSLQRSAVDLARASGDAIAGKVGDHGVVFLSAGKGSAQAKKERLLALGNKLAQVAERRFGLALHFGVGLGSGAVPLSTLYQDALGAAESALASGRAMVTASSAADRSPDSLRESREDLVLAVEERLSSLPARFDRYVEAVAVRSRYRMERARAELEICVERVADSLLRAGGLGERAWRAMREELDRAASEAATVSDLFAAYRRTVAEMIEILTKPVAARQVRSLRGALDYIHQHYAEPLTLPTVARIAGFEPKYFSRLLRRREAITFGRYVFRLRIERAKNLLTGTDLDATRVAELSGLGTPQHLCHAFRRAVGVTPLEYRASERPFWAKKHEDGRVGGNVAHRPARRSR